MKDLEKILFFCYFVVAFACRSLKGYVGEGYFKFLISVYFDAHS